MLYRDLVPCVTYSGAKVCTRSRYLSWGQYQLHVRSSPDSNQIADIATRDRRGATEKVTDSAHQLSGERGGNQPHHDAQKKLSKPRGQGDVLSAQTNGRVQTNLIGDYQTDGRMEARAYERCSSPRASHCML
jgi:hypothetical protein